MGWYGFSMGLWENPYGIGLIPSWKLTFLLNWMVGIRSFPFGMGPFSGVNGELMVSGRGPWVDDSP